MALNQAKRRIKAVPGNYTDYSRIAYNTAFSIVRHEEDAEDVAQITTMRLVLNQGKIKKESERNWVITTARHESFLVLEKSGRSVNVSPDSFDRLEQEITDYLLDDYVPNKKIADFISYVKETASPQDWKLLESYLLQGRRLCDLYPSLDTPLKKKSIRQKLYRLRKDLRTQYYKRNGMKASKKIVSFNLNQNIIRFLKKYRECLEKRSFETMSRYLSNIGIPKEVPNISIKRILDYDIQIVSSGNYEVFVFYIDKRKVVNTFTMSFSLDEKGNIVLTSIPNTTNLVQVHIADEKAFSADFLSKLDDVGDNGFLKISGKEIVSDISSNKRCNYRVKRIKKTNSISTE